MQKIRSEKCGEEKTHKNLLQHVLNITKYLVRRANVLINSFNCVLYELEKQTSRNKIRNKII